MLELSFQLLSGFPRSTFNISLTGLKYQRQGTYVCSVISIHVALFLMHVALARQTHSTCRIISNTHQMAALKCEQH